MQFPPGKEASNNPFNLTVKPLKVKQTTQFSRFFRHKQKKIPKIAKTTQKFRRITPDCTPKPLGALFSEARLFLLNRKSVSALKNGLFL